MDILPTLYLAFKPNGDIVIQTIANGKTQQTKIPGAEVYHTWSPTVYSLEAHSLKDGYSSLSIFSYGRLEPLTKTDDLACAAAILYIEKKPTFGGYGFGWRLFQLDGIVEDGQTTVAYGEMVSEGEFVISKDLNKLVVSENGQAIKASEDVWNEKDDNIFFSLASDVDQKFRQAFCERNNREIAARRKPHPISEF